MKKLKTLSIIPARGGSKGIPHKNIIKVAGRPLIAWTIKASLNSKYITSTFVSSDDRDILEISKKIGARCINRPKKYSQDDSTMVSVINNCLDRMKKLNELYDVIILLQPTSPLRNYKDINKAFEIFFESDARALISGFEPEKSPYKSFLINKKGFLEGLINDKFPFMNRQNLPKTFYPNGAIYIFYVKDYLKYNSLFSPKTIPYFMSIEKSVDVDFIEDVKVIENILKRTSYEEYLSK